MDQSHQLAWAAGLFEGEGSTSNGKPSRPGCRVRLYVTVGQKHSEVLERFCDAVGMGKVYGPNSRSMYQYRVSGYQSYLVIKLLWPYLGSVKKQQAIIAVRRWRNSGKRPLAHESKNPAAS